MAETSGDAQAQAQAQAGCEFGEAIGLPCVRDMFSCLAHAAFADGSDDKKLGASLEQIDKVFAGVKATQLRVPVGQGGAVSIAVDLVAANYDMAAELSPVQAALAAEEYASVLSNVSLALHSVRLAFAKHSRICHLFIEQMAKRLGDDPRRYFDLTLDPATSTLYLDKTWPRRLGARVALGTRVASQN
jgi:hypothetical protein